MCKALKEEYAGLTNDYNDALHIEKSILDCGYYAVITKVYICGEECYRVIAMKEK